MHANLIIQPRSGLTYTSIREGIYTECFTIFLDWYPERTGTMTLPADGEVAYTPRAELGEASARIMVRGRSTLTPGCMTRVASQGSISR